MTNRDERATQEDTNTIQLDQFFPHSWEGVWRALTTPELMTKWLMPNDFEPRVGHRFTMQASPKPAVEFSGTVACEVLALEPLQLLSISWSDAEGVNSLQSTVTWRLEPEGNGTRLFLEHAGFDPDNPTHQISRRTMSQGWRSHVLRRLGDLLEGLAPNVER